MSKKHLLPQLFFSGFWFVSRFPFSIHAVTGNVQFQNHAVVNQAVDCGSGSHGVLETLIPLAER